MILLGLAVLERLVHLIGVDIGWFSVYPGLATVYQ